MLLVDATADKISVKSNGSTITLAQLTGSTTSIKDFVNDVVAPIQMAIWEIMGTSAGSTDTNSYTEALYTQAKNEWTNVLQYSTNPVTAWLNANVQVFTTNCGGQSFISIATPEPGSMVLFGTGALLLGFGFVRRRLARRQR